MDSDTCMLCVVECCSLLLCGGGLRTPYSSRAALYDALK